jgi:hypothetical protein
MQKSEGHLGIDLVCNDMGLVVGVNVKKEVGEFMKNPCCDEVCIDRRYKLGHQRRIAIDVASSVGSNGRREAKGSAIGDVQESGTVIGEVKLVVLVMAHAIYQIAKCV